jgi:tetratricopeptide (TPR) repeat protein
MKMKANQFIWAASIFLLFFLASCAANLEEIKSQEEASRNLGEAYMGQGDYTAALREFLKAEKLYSKDPYLQNDLGLTYMAKEEIDLAIDHLKKAVEIKPDYAPAKNNLGTAYLAQKNWDDAIACFKGITEDLLYATPHYPLSNLGFAYYNKKEYRLAEKYYQDALKIEPGFAIALRGLGKTYIAMGKIPEAVAVFEKAIKHSPRFAEIYFDLADAYRITNDYKKALDAYSKVVELAPDTPLAIEAQKEAEKIKELRN